MDENPYESPHGGQSSEQAAPSIRPRWLRWLLIVIGLGSLFVGGLSANNGRLPDAVRFFAAFMFFISGALIGAGVMVPFKKARLGAYFGFFIQLGILAIGALLVG